MPGRLLFMDLFWAICTHKFKIWSFEEHPNLDMLSDVSCMIIMFNGNVIIKVNIALTFGGKEL